MRIDIPGFAIVVPVGVRHVSLVARRAIENVEAAPIVSPVPWLSPIRLRHSSPPRPPTTEPDP